MAGDSDGWVDLRAYAARAGVNVAWRDCGEERNTLWLLLAPPLLDCWNRKAGGTRRRSQISFFREVEAGDSSGGGIGEGPPAPGTKSIPPIPARRWDPTQTKAQGCGDGGRRRNVPGRERWRQGRKGMNLAAFFLWDIEGASEQSGKGRRGDKNRRPSLKRSEGIWGRRRPSLKGIEGGREGDGAVAARLAAARTSAPSSDSGLRVPSKLNGIEWGSVFLSSPKQISHGFSKKKKKKSVAPLFLRPMYPPCSMGCPVLPKSDTNTNM